MARIRDGSGTLFPLLQCLAEVEPTLGGASVGARGAYVDPNTVPYAKQRRRMLTALLTAGPQLDFDTSYVARAAFRPSSGNEIVEDAFVKYTIWELVDEGIANVQLSDPNASLSADKVWESPQLR